ncbi:MAG: PqqD family peptide modification chaperone [Planctomycetota bacterium]|nr:PqqD family peptide modification chaperone [Planctomycetota bacterium]
MAIERPTFSESWYRVAGLRPRLRSTVQVFRQHFRGQMWHVLQDPTSNQFFRLNESAYNFVAMLDGRRTVAEVWRICNEQLGDEAPTQGEAIQLLGQLYTSNLLHAELPPDAEGLLKRYRKRKIREIQGYVTNLLFARIPLIDPDHFLNRWIGVFGRVFTKYGLALWLVLIAVGFYFIVGRIGDLTNRASSVFDPANLPFLYLGMVVAKVFHEFGHAFACKRFGRLAGGGEVHVMGVMFLVFMPLPYVDASSAWAFRNKWHRVVVGAAGMFVELAIAAVAAIIWANTRSGTAAHAVCYNIMFIAGVSSLLFNGNPLLRYDAYYILSDLLEIPNLAQRSKEYIYYLVKRYVWSVRQARNPAHTSGERGWFVFYGIASTIYRIFIFSMILLFLTDRLPKPLAIVAIGFGAVAALTWLCIPLGKFIRYLATSGELARQRQRAVASTLVFIMVVFIGLGLISVPDRCRVEGIVEPINISIIHAEADGFVRDFLPSGRRVSPDGPVLLRCENPELKAQHEHLLAERRRLQVRLRIAQTQEPAAAQILTEQIVAIDEQILRTEEQIALLSLRAGMTGKWISPEIDRIKGGYVHRGDKVGLVADLERVFVRAVADQQAAAMLVSEAYDDVEIRLKGRSDMQVSGKKLQILPAGSKRLPSAALGYAVGGTMQTAPDDPHGTKSSERFFEIHVLPGEDKDVKLLSGQRVVVRFEMPAKPLLVQWWRSLLQLIQRRFHI